VVPLTTFTYSSCATWAGGSSEVTHAIGVEERVFGAVALLWSEYRSNEGVIVVLGLEEAEEWDPCENSV
jgi:hypothetical protein